LNGIPVDAGLGAVTHQECHRSRAHNHRHDRNLHVARPLEVPEQDHVEPAFDGTPNDRTALLAGARQEARKIERNADAQHALSRSTASERVPPLRYVPLHEEKRRVVEELAREVEEQVQQRVAIVRLFPLASEGFERQRAASTTTRTKVGSDVALEQLVAFGTHACRDRKGAPTGRVRPGRDVGGQGSRRSSFREAGPGRVALGAATSGRHGPRRPGDGAHRRWSPWHA
jgi:hypothetical protein